MNNSEKFQSIYNAELLPVLQPIEQERKKIVLRIWLLILLAVAALVYLVASGTLVQARSVNDVNKTDDRSSFPFLLMLGAGAATYFYYKQQTALFKKKYKDEVVPKMLTSLDAGLHYEANRNIDRQDYERSKLFLDSVNVFYGDDYVSGTIGKTAIRFSELHSQEIKRTNKGEHRKDIFRGIFFIADFNKKFSGETFVLPDVTGNLFGSFFQKMNASRPQLIKMEDPEFEKAFVVYSTDQVEAHYILSTALMSRIVAFKKKFKMRLSLSFVNSQVYMALPINKQLFEAPSILKSFIDKKKIFEYLGYLSMCIEIVEGLDLNTRVWTKE